MKKHLSIVLAVTIALTSVTVQAGDTAKKVWAYTKIGCGLLCLVDPLLHFGVAIPNTRIEVSSTFYGLLAYPQWKDTVFGEKFIKRTQKRVIPWITTIIPLGIFAIQSGRRDLKKLRKKATKEQAEKNATVCQTAG